MSSIRVHLRSSAVQIESEFRAQFSVRLDTKATPWQETVWERLCAIPSGETTSYSQIARELDREGAQRAEERPGVDQEDYASEVPLLAMTCYSSHDWLHGNRMPVCHDLIDVSQKYELPLRPILPDILINTLFYAVIWFGLFFGIGTARRTIRRRRGRCEQCGYDLRGHQDHGHDARAIGCPECGWRRSSSSVHPKP